MVKKVVQTITILMSLTFLSCGSVPYSKSLFVAIPLNNNLQQISKENIENVRQSFLQINKSIVVTVCKPETKKQKRKRLKRKKRRECDTMDLGALGSGFAIMKTIRNDTTGSLIITAGHVCSNEQALKHAKTMGVPQDDLKITHEGIDLKLNRYELEILAISKRSDLCLAFAKGFNASVVPPVKHMFKPGESVWNVAAPVGEFHENMVPIFPGFYSGLDENGNSSFTVPAAHGSSGSPIINSHGELVGVLVSLHREFHNLSFSPPLDAIYNFILNNCKDCKLQYHIEDNRLKSLRLE